MNGPLDGGAYVFTSFIALHTKGNGLTWQDIAVPADIARGIGIIARKSGIPAVGYRRAITISPIHAPAIDQCVSDIGQAHFSDKSRVPFVRDHVIASETAKTAAARA